MSLTNLLLGDLKRHVSSYEMIPSSGGCFEVTIDGDLVYSKLDTGEFPDEDEILRTARQRL